MALQYVGGTSGTGTSTGYTVSLSGTLTGGIASSPSTGDIVIVFSGFGNTASASAGIDGDNSGAYSLLPGTTQYHQNDTYDTEFAAFYAVMGGSVDTTLTVTRVTNAAYGGATVVQVWRGQDTSSPFDVASTVAGAGNTGLINPAAITPVTSGAWILAGGAGTQTSTGSAFTVSSNMTGPSVSTFGNGSTSDIGVCIASHEWTSGSFTPNAVTGGSVNASCSWRSMTLALRPLPATATGTLDASESGSDTFAASGTVAWTPVTGSLAVSEAATKDTFASSGDVFVAGSLAATDGVDTFDSNGDVFVKGTLVSTEAATDAFAASGTVTDKTSAGPLAATETGSDTFASNGDVFVKGSLAVSETATKDTFASNGDVFVAGSLAVAEAGSDTLAATGKVVVKGTLAVAEAGSDTLAATGKVVVKGTLAATDAADTFSGVSGPAPILGTFAAAEAGADVLAASGGVAATGSLAAAEAATPDTLAADGVVVPFVSGDLIATEAGSDAVVSSGIANDTFTITGAQALLIRRLAQLHGLLAPLQVSDTARTSGDLQQTIAVVGGTVTISTTDGNDTISGDVGALIEELAALHGLAGDLTVTSSRRSAGSVIQVFSRSGGVTTVTRQ